MAGEELPDFNPRLTVAGDNTINIGTDTTVNAADMDFTFHTSGLISQAVNPTYSALTFANSGTLNNLGVTSVALSGNYLAAGTYTLAKIDNTGGGTATGNTFTDLNAMFPSFNGQYLTGNMFTLTGTDDDDIVLTINRAFLRPADRLAMESHRLALWEPWRSPFERLENPVDLNVTNFNGRCQTRKMPSRSAWFEGFYRSSDSLGYDIDRSGLMTGIDWRVGTDTRLGILFSYSRPDLEADNGRIKADEYLVGLYGKKRVFDDFYMNGFLGYGNLSYDYLRRDDAGFYTSDYNGSALYGSLELMRPFRYGNCTIISPLVAIDYQHSWADSIYEDFHANLSGLASHAQNYGKSDLAEVTARLGVKTKTALGDRFDFATRLQNGYNMGDDSANSTVRYWDVANLPLTVNGLDYGRHHLLVGFGGRQYFGAKRMWQIYFDYDFDYAENAKSHSVWAGLLGRW